MSIDLKQWERHFALDDGRKVHIRPIKPKDAALYAAFFSAEDALDLRLRFFGSVKERDGTFFSRFTQIDYATAMAFIAIDQASGEMLGVARLHDNADADDRSAEFAIIVRSDLKGRGLGWQLMQLIIAYARVKRLRSVEGQVLQENRTMLDMCKELGFAIGTDPDAPYIATVSLLLDPTAPIIGSASPTSM